MLEHFVEGQAVMGARARSAWIPRTGRRQGYRVVKRLIDITLVLLSAPLTLPLILVMALLVRMDGGPAFYRQPRIGRHGHVFLLWKLRSMVPDADKALEAYLDANPAEKAEWDKHQKLRRDPRLTAIGPFLRRYSLDELPQLWNVLIGDMSIVGPRPMMPQQRLLYEGFAYYDLRPGLTGLWQISERNNCSFAERARYDELYWGTISAATDIRTIFRTVGVVLGGTGY
ncbi:sugar transferase [Devosia sp. SD17-2]|uniref:sugar transferase n=1 Tax=Devosia sp. SD17-2 TaxID=2976459 RepID=UPI0023D81620|nr:sugar transferase [Devosia sp. SD17-2]WEJ34194.1 sugar transferase [Devosia sp. SD17-2]